MTAQNPRSYIRHPFLFLGLYGLSVLCGCGGGTAVETVNPRRGGIQESFREPARTHLKNTYIIAMPIDGRIERIDLEPGDAVQKDQIAVPFDTAPLERTLAEARASTAELEARIAVNEFNKLEDSARIEAQAMVDASSHSLQAFDAQVEAKHVRSERASKHLSRIKALADQKQASASQLDDAALEADTAIIELREQEFYRSAIQTIISVIGLGPQVVEDWLIRKSLQRDVLTHQLAQARARLENAVYNRRLADMKSPIDGIVLERYEEGGQWFPAGQRLLLLGNLDELEAIADVLTQDAVHLRPGSRVLLELGRGQEELEAQVKQVEPMAFTKLSSLGIEQQRVNIIITLDERPGYLGVGYRLQARFFTGTQSNALIIPRFSVMQAPDGTYYVLKVVEGTIQKQSIRLGLKSDLELEVIEGLSEEDRIVAHPDTTMTEGMRIRTE